MRLIEEVKKAKNLSKINRHRFLVFICSEDVKKAIKIVKKIKEELGGEWVVVGRERFINIFDDLCEMIHWKDSANLLGRTVENLVIDFTEGFHPNDLGIVVETVAEGGAIVAVSPPLETWQKMKSRWHEDLVSEPYSIEDVVGRFYRRFIEKTLKSEGLVAYDADSEKIFKEFKPSSVVVPREEIVIPEEREIKKKLYKLCATQDQIRVLQVFERFFKREKERKAIIITADRGRGKTAVLGIATPYLISKMERLLKRPVRILVVAPTPHAVQTYFKFLIKAMKRQGMTRFFVKENEEGLITVVNSRYARIEYAVPRRAIEEKGLFDILIVDEAAGIEAPVLLEISKDVRHVIFSTTIHGYEGTGRSFNVRFLRRLEKEDIEIERIHMFEPIRYGAGDPVERYLYETLLLDAQPAELGEEDMEKISKGELEFTMLDREELLRKDKELREFFGIYVLAHYRNRPSDLAILLDMPNHLTFAVKVNGKILCSIHAAIEGNLSNELLEKLRHGYKPKGQIIPDLIYKHYWNPVFPKKLGVRIVRIATHPNAMGKGVGSFALRKIVEWAEKNGLEWVGSGFGVSSELLRFWFRNGFTPVHITPQRNEVSGEYTAIVIKAISDEVRKIVDEINSEFTRRFIELLSDELRDLETESAILILNSLQKDIPCHLPAFTHVELERIKKYFEGLSLYEYVSDLMRPLTRFFYSHKDKMQIENEDVLVAKCLQLKPWKDITGDKYKALQSALATVWKFATKKLLSCEDYAHHAEGES